MQLKMEELKLKQAKQLIDAAAKQDQLRIEEERIKAQKEIAAMQVGASTAAAKDKLNKQMELDGARLGADIAKHKSQLAHQSRQSAMQAVQQARQQQKQQPKKGD
jgi:hypothetical protein